MLQQTTKVVIVENIHTMTSVYLENTSSVQGTSPSPQVTLNGSYVLGNGCVVLKVTAFTPWDSPDNLVSAATERLVDRVKAAVVVPLCFFIGGAGNCLNMAVFLKQGLRERINMCLFTLALLDFVYLSFAFFIYGERITALFNALPRVGPVHQFAITNHLLFMYGIAWATFFMAAVIASERCFCIISPILSKTALKTRTLAIIISISSLLIIIGYTVISEKWTTICIYNPDSNSALTQMTMSSYYHRNKQIVDIFDGVIYGLLLPGICDIVLAICTVVMAVHLKRVVAWRDKTSSAVSTKEVLLTKMLICLCIEFNSFTTANVPFRVVSMMADDVSGSGRFYNMFFLTRSILEMLSLTHSSLHFFIYFSFGSRYRKTLKQLCSCIERQ